MRLQSPLVLLLHAVGLASAAAVAADAACPNPLPTWTIKSLKTQSGTGLTSGKATFDFVDNTTNRTETLSCTLRNGYRCEITPSDKTMLLSLQIQIDILYFTMSTGKKCDSGGSSRLILGSGELELQCHNDGREAITCTLDEGLVTAWLD